MCFDDDSAPPIPPISGAAVSHADLVLEAADGNTFAAFLAEAEEQGPGVVILPDVRGLYRFYEELALRFAERGITALAFDYFGRTAGVEKRDNDWDYMPLVQQLTMEQVQADVAACVAHLRTLAGSGGGEAAAARPESSPAPEAPGGGCDPIFTVGFCYGGSGSWAAAASGHGLAGAVGFYGRPGRMLDLVPQLDAPILALQGGDDQGIPHEDNVAFEEALQAAGKDYELVEFEGAPHSFFDRKQEEFAEASEEAWNRVLSFIQARS